MYHQVCLEKQANSPYNAKVDWSATQSNLIQFNFIPRSCGWNRAHKTVRTSQHINHCWNTNAHFTNPSIDDRELWLSAVHANRGIIVRYPHRRSVHYCNPFTLWNTHDRLFSFIANDRILLFVFFQREGKKWRCVVQWSFMNLSSAASQRRTVTSLTATWRASDWIFTLAKNEFKRSKLTIP